jgi:hypothetical protein
MGIEQKRGEEVEGVSEEINRMNGKEMRYVIKAITEKREG